MTAAILSYNVPALPSPMDAAGINSTAPTAGMFANGWIPFVDVIEAERQNYLHNVHTSYLWLVQALGLAMPFNPASGASIVATKAGGIVSLRNNSTSATEFYVALVNMPIGYTDPSLDPTNWALIDFQKLAKAPPAFAVAGGTADAITASVTTPYPALTNGFTLTVEIATPNATTTPTLQPTLVNTNQSNAQTARTVVKYAGATKVPVAIGDLQGRCNFTYDSSGTPQYILMNPATERGEEFFSVSSTASAGALTCGFAAGQLIKFRSSTLTDGVPATLFNAAALSVVAPSGATLGATTTVMARIYLAVFNDGGTLRLAINNATSTTILDEDELQTTTAISAGATSSNTWYSTVAVTNPSAYRIVGFVEAVNTAGAWASPTTVQPGGGLALSIPIAQVSLFGAGSANLAGTKSAGTPYTPSTSKPTWVTVLISATTTAGLTITLTGGKKVSEVAYNGTSGSVTAQAIVPSGQAYTVVNAGGTISEWYEYN